MVVVATAIVVVGIDVLAYAGDVITVAAVVAAGSVTSDEPSLLALNKIR